MNVKEATKQLGEVLAASDEVKGFLAAKAAYENSVTIQEAIREYGAQRMLLGQEHAKDTAMQDAELMEKLQARIGELYEEITTATEYLALNEAQQKVNALMQEVNGDINFYVFGERPCTHDCSSCGADCSSRG